MSIRCRLNDLQELCNAEYPSDTYPLFGRTTVVLAWFKFVNGSWQELPGVTITGNTASFSLVDNGPFDADPATGAIRDPSGPAFPAQQGAPTPGVNGDPRPIPAASGIALFVLFVLLAVLGIRSQRGLHA